MYDLVRNDDYPYLFDANACAECGGRCCTGESGNIFVSAGEIRELALLKKMSEHDFIECYLEKRGYKYSLKEKRIGDSYDCIFYDRQINGCAVYEARPKQCRTFPFWDYYKTRVAELKQECPGVIDA
ncbi:MAG: zinc/iron-chelating domain-containing protein [Helicobacteraceae bacterium 4484_230]|nr:MAG: zinc/iron-chelating domain-containing protein [Helicobacteraceae bacterium 4484_230]